MLKYALILVAICVTCQGRSIFDSKNVVTVPHNCPTGQQWLNGECRDVWRNVDVAPINVVTVPPNCPEGQEYYNGECRDVWVNKIIKALVILDRTKADQVSQTDDEHKNVITVPPNCPSGQEWVNGECRDVWKRYKNAITVPPNCPSGQQYINGECRDVWIKVENYLM